MPKGNEERPLGDVTFRLGLHDDGKRLVVECDSVYVYLGPSSGAGPLAAGEAIAAFVVHEIAKRSGAT